MKNYLALLFILIIIGILWLGSKFWEFSEETYIKQDIVERTRPMNKDIDFDYLKKEFAPAYEF